MCPECISAAALLTAGVTSTGGIATFVVSKLRSYKKTNDESDTNKNGDKDNG